MKFQMKLLWKTPSFWLMLGFMCLFCVGTFCASCLPYYGIEFMAVPAADQLYIGRGTVSQVYLLGVLLPLIAALPFADSYFCEKQKNTLPILLTKYKTASQYFFSKGAAVFLSAVLLVLVPFLLNMLLNLLAFPISAIADYTNLSTDQSMYYVEPYITVNVLFPRLLVLHPYLYNFLFCIAISLFSGLLGVTAYVLSYYVARNRIWAIVSVFILNNLLAIVSGMCEPKANFAFLQYLFVIDSHEGKKPWMFFAALAVLLLAVALLSRRAIAKLDNVLCDAGASKKLWKRN